MRVRTPESRTKVCGTKCGRYSAAVGSRLRRAQRESERKCYSKVNYKRAMRRQAPTAQLKIETRSVSIRAAMRSAGTRHRVRKAVRARELSNIPSSAAAIRTGSTTVSGSKPRAARSRRRSPSISTLSQRERSASPSQRSQEQIER